MHKPFDQALFDANDPIARAAVSRYLVGIGADVMDGDKYGVDLWICRGLKKVSAVEIERRELWKDTFRFNTVHVPERKRKFFIDSQFPTFLFAVRNDCQVAMWCCGKIILQSPVVNVPNKHMEKEHFFDVPFKHWHTVRLPCKK